MTIQTSVRMFRALPVLIILVALVAGCTKRKHIADKHYYRLQPDMEWVQSEQTVRPVPLYIPRAQAAGVVGSRPMLARADDDSLVQMHHHFWLDSPRAMWQTITLDWAMRSRLWPQVYEIKPVNLRHDTLLTTILALEKSGSRAIIRIRAVLLDKHGKQRYQAIFDRQQELKENTISAFADAVNSLSEVIFRELDADLRSVLTMSHEQADQS